MNLIDPTGMGEEDPIDPPKPGTGKYAGASCKWCSKRGRFTN